MGKVSASLCHKNYSLSSHTTQDKNWYIFRAPNKGATFSGISNTADFCCLKLFKQHGPYINKQNIAIYVFFRYHRNNAVNTQLGYNVEPTCARLNSLLKFSSSIVTATQRSSTTSKREKKKKGRLDQSPQTLTCEIYDGNNEDSLQTTLWRMKKDQR